MAIETTVDRYWDCECEQNYIHPKTIKQCWICGAKSSQQPDSIAEEVKKYIREKEKGEK